ncbi:tetratricopeptide repeat protein [Burkholderia sp. S-53]|uniref:tetratricopeptide repeat protein n=1 Tax=Burkholderia sp. S-53 TaxID=2906514 RepID=UPI0021D2DBD8|nr:hypothetical protein [Burkholderia sp. S-53]UXU89097.1 hypothetical protein LXM88_11750 [Burkholderia sp. S-53]
MIRNLRVAMRIVSIATVGIVGGALSAYASAAGSQPVDGLGKIETIADCRAAIARLKPDDSAAQIDVASRCLALPDSGILARALFLRIRGEAYAAQHDPTSAIANLEEAYRLVPPKTGWEVISLASAYYDAARYADEVALIQDAMRKEIGMSGRGSGFGMPLYYHLGRGLVALKRNEEAIEALTAGIPAQPDFPYAYWYRSLAYENLHDEEHTKADLEQFARWVRSDKLTTDEQSRLKQYGIQR